MIDLLCLDGLLNPLCFSAWLGPLDPCRFGAVVDDNVNEMTAPNPQDMMSKRSAKHIGGATADHDYCTTVMASRSRCQCDAIAGVNDLR